MSVWEMWRGNAFALFILIIVDLGLISIGGLAWIVLGILALLVGGFFAFRRGMAFGHEACSILETVRRAEDPESPAHGQLDEKVLRRVYSPWRGLRGTLLSALIPYLASCVYMLSLLLNWSGLIIHARTASLILALPYWPLLQSWYESFDQLTPAIAAMLMISPFVLPLCCCAGYLQGPKLWAKSETAMAQGKRRAKAKSRVVRKRVPKAQKPEI